MIHFGSSAPHDGGNTHRHIVAINNDTIHCAVNAEGTGHPIKGHELLALPGPSHPDVPACQLGTVKGMRGGTQLQHDVVGGINQIVDGPHASRHQSGLDVGRRRGDQRPFDGRDREPIAQVVGGDGTDTFDWVDSQWRGVENGDDRRCECHAQ